MGATAQCLLLATAFGGVMLLLAMFQPFKHRAVGNMAAQSCACLLYSTQAALVFDMVLPEDPRTPTITNGVAASAIVVNGVFVLSVLWRLLRAVDWASVRSAMSRVTKSAGAKCSLCGCHGNAVSLHSRRA